MTMQDNDKHYFLFAPLKALSAAETRHSARWIARSLVWLFLLLLLLLSITPWQQNIRGVGRVIAYMPSERQQFVSAPVEGRITKWLIKEGAQVKQGDVLAELLDNDPLLVERLQSEQQALLARQIAVENRVETFREQVRMSERARPQALSAAQSRINMAQERQKAAHQAVIANKAANQTSRKNLDRQAQLQSKGLASTRTLELTQLEMAQRDAEVARSQATLEAAKNEVDALQADWQKLVADSAASIEKARADLNKTIEDQNYIKTDLLKLETRLARQKNLTVTAPRDGTVLRLLANPNAEMIKAGQAIAILIPHTEQRAVELWIDGNDLPLIVTESRVRLQFEGYPSIQFGGWPEFSVGSFAGKVALIDSTDDGKGHFRILVTPDVNEIAWPNERFLRQGVRTNGWVLLGKVTLGYELWRIFNNFPLLVLPEHNLTQDSKDSKSKDSDKSYDASAEKKDDK